ncbi:MAG: glutamyl-tRNA reductase [Candidatus Omnitrophica bacterium]|nr:glutamyl-tRNA reductase [Candidatus Omnitrophota bacterium]
MDIITIGINHKTAEIKERERFFLTKEKLKQFLTGLYEINPVSGVVILSTCNRMEIYVHMDYDFETGKEKIKEFIYDNFRCDERIFNKYFYMFENIDAIKHLFRVSSGIDSQILGETEILGQVKDAFLIANEMETMDTFIEELFSKAIYTGKMARSKTNISRGNISVAGIAIKKCEDFWGSLEKKECLIIGAGNVASLLSKYLKGKNMKGIFVSNRTFEKAKELAYFCNGIAIRFDSIDEKLKNVDIVISSTSSPHVILKKDKIMEIMKERKKPLLILDLSVPRDVDPSVKEINDVYLNDLDNLKSVVEENYKKRRKEAEKVEKIIENEIKKFAVVEIS